MKIDTILVKKLRTQNNWTQEQLGAASGLSMRTVQRLENTGKASADSVKALAGVFNVEPGDLLLLEREPDAPMTPIDAVKIGFSKYADFSGTAMRYEYWWLLLFILLVFAVASVISEQLLQIVAVILLLPLLAAGTRRLRDTGQSGWWQLLLLVPFGFVPVFVMLAMESKEKSS